MQQFKPIIDEIDRVLAPHYGFTAEELDDLINYDIKYCRRRDNEYICHYSRVANHYT